MSALWYLIPAAVVYAAGRLVIAWQRAADVIGGCPVCGDHRHEDEALDDGFRGEW